MYILIFNQITNNNILYIFINLKMIFLKSRKIIYFIIYILLKETICLLLIKYIY